MRVNVQVNKIIGYFHIQEAEKAHQWKNVEVNHELWLINHLASCPCMHKPSTAGKPWPLQGRDPALAAQPAGSRDAGCTSQGLRIGHHLRKGYLKDECCITTGWGSKPIPVKPDNRFWHLETFYPSKLLESWAACLNVLFLWRSGEIWKLFILSDLFYYFLFV